jgi:hypothetical protein
MYFGEEKCLSISHCLQIDLIVTYTLLLHITIIVFDISYVKANI